MTDTDLSVIEVLDFDFEPPCEGIDPASGREPCSNAGNWKVKMSCCGIMLLICEGHKNALMMSNGKIRHEMFMKPCGGTEVYISLMEKI